MTHFIAAAHQLQQNNIPVPPITLQNGQSITNWVPMIPVAQFQAELKKQCEPHEELISKLQLKQSELLHALHQASIIINNLRQRQRGMEQVLLGNAEQKSFAQSKIDAQALELEQLRRENEDLRRKNGAFEVKDKQSEKIVQLYKDEYQVRSSVTKRLLDEKLSLEREVEEWKALVDIKTIPVRSPSSCCCYLSWGFPLQTILIAPA